MANYSLNKSESSYIFGDGKPSPSLGRAKIEFLDHVFNIDIVSCDVPGLIGVNTALFKKCTGQYFKVRDDDFSSKQGSLCTFKIILIK